MGASRAWSIRVTDEDERGPVERMVEGAVAFGQLLRFSLHHGRRHLLGAAQRPAAQSPMRMGESNRTGVACWGRTVPSRCSILRSNARRCRSVRATYTP